MTVQWLSQDEYLQDREVPCSPALPYLQLLLSRLLQQPACTGLQGASRASNSAHPVAQRLLWLLGVLRLFSVRKKKTWSVCMCLFLLTCLFYSNKEQAVFFSPAGCVGWLGPCIREPETARTSPQKWDCFHG